MKMKSLILTAAVVAALAGVAFVAQQTESTGSRMATAAERFLTALTPKQKEQATFPYDSKERTNWFFVPKQNAKREYTRKGLPLLEMTETQKKLALELLASGTSSSGKKKAMSIMMLEAILNKLQQKGRGSVREKEWYFVTIFGTPSKTGNWGWRLEGHHLSLNYTVHGGRVVSTTPAFFGSNPAMVKKELQIPGAMPETLPDAENLARTLVTSLDEEQKKTARREKHFGESKQGSAYAKVGEPVGLTAAKMTKKQRTTLMRLLESYVRRMPAEVARRQLKEVRQAAAGKIHFAWSGEAKRGQPHTYRIQGPTFVVEFLNTQPSPDGTKANHIHSSWRRLGGDFGLAAD